MHTHITLSTLKNVLLYLSMTARHTKISEVTGKLFFSVCPTVYDVNVRGSTLIETTHPGQAP